MVIIRLDKRMPQAAFRGVFHTVDMFQIREDRLAEFRNRDKLVFTNLFRDTRCFIAAENFIAVYFDDGKRITDLCGLPRNSSAFFDFHSIQRRAFGQVFLKHQPEFFVLCEPIVFLRQSCAEGGILHLL